MSLANSITSSHTNTKKPPQGPRSKSKPSYITRSNSIKSVSTSLNLNNNDYLSGPSDTEQGYDSEYDNDSNNNKYSISTVAATLDNSLPSDYFKQDILSLIKSLNIPKWSKLPSKLALDLNVFNISGALTNVIYKIDPPSSKTLKKNKFIYFLNPLLLRIYGPGSDSLIDRDYELLVLSRLSKKNIGPKLLGSFSNGRFEQWLNNAQVLKPTQVADLKLSRTIARRMKQLHIGIQLNNPEINNGPSIWKRIDDWLNLAELTLNLNKINASNFLLSDFQTYKNIINKYKLWLYNRYKSIQDLKDSLVFCHNDTQYGNILFTTSTHKDLLKKFNNANLSDNNNKNDTDNVNEEEEQKEDKRLVVIDFEYAGANVPAYDIANHFMEWLADYTNSETAHLLVEDRYPSDKQITNFLASYIKYHSTIHNNTEELEKQVKILYNDIIAWRAASNIVWSLWGIISNSDFHKKVVIEDGPKGEKYKILNEDSNNIKEEEQEANEIELFDHFGYSNQKAGLVWGDLIQLGIATKDDVEHSDQIKYLPVKFFHI
ncbi:choline/ethanolamine kinase [Ascoidea rubescens DSM 1968]|uniref:Kinase-like protein n=1 Tax=Ascoidea rubescens DSM 1968 TaxID=1344418 RepID=A0A1D2VJ02_9ASCO|nr:kinase-like protein [Ascoidea rubescens DSM 1968]ODV61550.1 kinase-like protein [Ascoidea rubescens DSM 1968]